MYTFQMYSCPKCGKKDSSHDGMTFCGVCETEYQAEREKEAKIAYQDYISRKKEGDENILDWYHFFNQYSF